LAFNLNLINNLTYHEDNYRVLLTIEFNESYKVEHLEERLLSKKITIFLFDSLNKKSFS